MGKRIELEHIYRAGKKPVKAKPVPPKKDQPKEPKRHRPGHECLEDDK